MIELLSNVPPNVIGFKATGEVTKGDYDDVVFPQIEKHLDEGFKLNYVFVIDTSLKNFTAAAWMQDAWLGLKKIAKWRKVAIVSDLESVRKFTDSLSHFVPGEYKGFTSFELSNAVIWAAA